MSPAMLNPLPPHQIRVHPRAKRWKIRILPNGEILVTVPKRFALRRVPDILHEQRDWITHNLPDYPRHTVELPEQLNLRALAETWVIRREIHRPIPPRVLSTAPWELTLFGEINPQDATQLKRAFQPWLKEQALRHFRPWLDELSVRHRLPYASLAIRGQRSRWGSCSPDQAITLNYKLLFMPPNLAEHVMLHELCHTRHLDHSAHFWHLLCTLDPQFEQNRQGMRAAHRFLPAFLNE
jgi:predicted metal-dependent hydrolase